MSATSNAKLLPFNGAIEIGLRALVLLSEAYPVQYSMQWLVVSDYMLVHSDDVPDGPIGLHPKTPHRGGEMLVRRASLQQGLMLYQSRGLLERHYSKTGLTFAATERSASFLDSLISPYVAGLRSRSEWLLSLYGDLSDSDILKKANAQTGQWGAEFTLESVLLEEEFAWR